jgi:hypothetical protein
MKRPEIITRILEARAAFVGEHGRGPTMLHVGRPEDQEIRNLPNRDLWGVVPGSARSPSWIVLGMRVRVEGSASRLICSSWLPE